jgi:hypothetical protein
MKIRTLFLSLALAGTFALPATLHARDFRYSARNLRGAYTFRLVPAVSFAAFTTSGGVATAPRQDILRIGTFVADGKGNVTGRIVATTDDNNGATEVKDFSFSGTYTVDADGFGTLSIAPVGTVTDEGAETYAIKLNDRIKTVHLIQTDNAGGGAKIFLTGDASVERPIGTSDFGQD